MRRNVLLALTLSLILSLSSIVYATNGYQLTGIGQMQESMGGAVTAAPMDAMTAVTNPAGLARIGSRADFAMQAFMPKRSVNFTATGGETTTGGSELYGIPSIGWSAPAFNREDVYFGGGMFVTSGLGVDYGQSIYMPGAALDSMAGAPSGTFEDVTFDGFSAIQFWKISPAAAWNVNNTLSLGAALNLDYQSVTIREKIRNVPFWNNPANQSLGMTQMDVSLDLGRPTSQMGIGATIGALYDLNDMITIGASYSSKQSFSEGQFRVGQNDILNYNGAKGLPGIYKLDLQFPQQAALGVSVKPINSLLVAFDVKWINWSSTHDKVKLTGPANSFDSNADGAGDTDSTELEFGWEDQYVIAAGAQYKATEVLALRAGYNYSKSPIDEADVFNNLIFPAIVQHHVAVGADYALGKHWGIGATYAKALKETLTGEGDVPAGFQQMTPFPADSGSEISLEEDSLGVQLTYIF